jgi:hypothetical protein
VLLDSECYSSKPTASHLSFKNYLPIKIFFYFLGLLQKIRINFAIGCGPDARICERAAPGYARTGTGKIFYFIGPLFDKLSTSVNRTDKIKILLVPDFNFPSLVHYCCTGTGTVKIFFIGPL